MWDPSSDDVTYFIYKHLYCNRDWKISIALTDTEIDNREWDKPTYLLETTIPYYQYTYLAIQNLTKHFKLYELESKLKLIEKRIATYEQ